MPLLKRERGRELTGQDKSTSWFYSDKIAGDGTDPSMDKPVLLKQKFGEVLAAWVEEDHRSSLFANWPYLKEKHFTIGIKSLGKSRLLPSHRN